MKGMYSIAAITMIGILLLSIIFGGGRTGEEQGEIIDVEPYKKDITRTEYDVIVVSGEPEGVAAAVAAARNGAKTLLIEHRDGLGGLMTYGMLNFIDLGYDKNDNVANAGIFEEWHKLVGGDYAFDIQRAKNAFMKLVQDEPNITLSLNTQLQDVIMAEDGETIHGVIVEDENGVHEYYAKRFIDSSLDADLAVLAGAPYFIGNEDIGLVNEKMAVTLMIHLEGIDWEGIKKAAREQVFGEGYVTSNVAWGFGALHFEYKPVEPNTRLRGLNIARQEDGSIYINALQIFEVDGLNKASIQEGIERGKRETDHVVEFLRAEFPGFENARVASYPDELYIRETRHVRAEYQLPITDVWENKDHWDSIGFGSYPVDVQATSIKNYGYVIATPRQYAIPFRSLVPLEVEGLLVASKASGYSSLAAGSARIIPTGMTTAQAAGIASTISIEHNISFREMAKNEDLIARLQNNIIQQGGLLYPYQLSYPYEGEWFYPSIAHLLSYGLVSGGYDNNLMMEEPLGQGAMLNILENGYTRIHTEEYKEAALLKEFRANIQDTQGPILRDDMLSFLITLEGHNVESDVWQQAVQLSIVDEEMESRLAESRELTRAEGFYLLADHLSRIVNDR
jgi:hypothetical protein